MSIKSLHHRVTLQTRSSTSDSNGQPLTTWANTAAIWAHVAHESGMGAIKGGQDVSIVKASIRIRHRSVNAGQRVLWGTQVYDIKAVLPDGKDTFIDLVCEAVNVAS